MKIINFLASIITSAVLFACSTKSYEYTVEVTLPDENLYGQTLYLSEYLEGVRSIGAADSAIVNDKGKVIFEGEIRGTAIRRFDLPGYGPVTFILEPGTIYVDVVNNSVTGTSLNDKMMNYISSADSMNSYYEVLYDEISLDSLIDNDLKVEKLNVIMAEYSRNQLENAHHLVAQNRDNAFGQFVFWWDIAYNEQITPEMYKNELNAAGEFIANFGPIIKISKRYEALAETCVGTKFKDFEIPYGYADSTTAKLSDFAGKGKLLLVDFWASWCAPCRRAIPEIKSVYEKYKGDDFDVLGIAVWDNRKNTENAVNQLDIEYPMIYDALSIPTELYGVNSIPHLMLIAPDGTILARGLHESAIDHWVTTELKSMRGEE